MQFKALAPDRDLKSIKIQECEPSVMCIYYTDALTNRRSHSSGVVHQNDVGGIKS